MSGDVVKAAVVVGAVAALPVAAGWASGFTIGSLSPALSTFIVSAGSSLVLSTVNQKLAPDINLPDIGTSLQANTTVTVKEPTQAHRVVYGTTRVGGNIVFAETTNDNKYLHLVIAFTGHEITDFSKIYFGEDEVSLTNNGLHRQDFNGYYSDNLNFFNNLTPVSESTLTSINGITTSPNTTDRYFGFINPTSTATHDFQTTSDDSSRVYIGDNGQSIESLFTEIEADSSAKLVVNNGGLHSTRTESGSKALTSGEKYPVIIYYGNGPSNTNMTFQWRVSGGTYDTDLSSIFTLDTDSNGQEIFVPAKGDEYEGKARVKKHLGANNQLADADLVSEVTEWTTDHRLRGRSYLYVRLEFDSDVYPNGVPNITAEIQGKKVFDPRDSSTSLSSNPALCIRDYLTNSDYGMKADASEIDDTNFSAVANTCDETVTLDSGSENRFTLNGTFQASQTPKNVLQNMLSCIGGHLVYSNGQFKLVAATYKTPTITLDESNLRSGLTVNTRVSKKELFNAVKGIYSEPLNKYQPQDYPVLTNATFEEEDNNERNYAEFNFPFTTSSQTCQRLAKIQLLKARQQITLVATFDLNAFELNVGDTVQITNSRMGFSSKTFEVANWNLSVQSDSDGSPALIVNCELRETASEIYDFNTTDYSTISSGKATNLPKASQVTAPTAITLSDELVAYNDGTVIVKLVIDITAPADSFTELFEVEIRQDTDADGNAVTDDFKGIARGARTKFEFLNVINGAQYTVRVRSINIFGTRSSFISEQHEVVTAFEPPQNVQNYSIDVVGDKLHHTFDAVPDLDLDFYEIRFTSDTTETIYSNTTVLVPRIARPATSVVTPFAGTGAYFIKAVDKFGVRSTSASIAVIEEQVIDGAKPITTITEETAFTGTKTDCVVVDNALVLDTSINFDSLTGNFDDATGLFDGGGGNISTSGTYEFDGFDFGAKFKFKLLLNNLNVDHISYTDSFDSQTGLFDSKQGLFDGDTDEEVSTDVQLQIAKSDDNVTFGSFKNFKSGDFVTRAVKFKALLTTTDTGATPKINNLSLKLLLPTVIQDGSNVSSGTDTAGKTVTFDNRYYQAPTITIIAQDLNTGDFFTLNSKSETNFNIEFFDSSGNTVDRTFDFQAVGLGSQQ